MFEIDPALFPRVRTYFFTYIVFYLSKLRTSKPSHTMFWLQLVGITFPYSVYWL